MPQHASTCLHMPLPSTCACPAVNPNVEIKEVPARTLVALSWHGSSPREAEVERRTEQLRQLMAQAGLKPKAGGKTHVWQYGEGGFWGGVDLCVEFFGCLECAPWWEQGSLAGVAVGARAQKKRRW